MKNRYICTTVLYLLIKNKQEMMIGTIQWTSIKTPVRMFPISAPDLPNIVPIDVAMPLQAIQNKNNQQLMFSITVLWNVYLYSVGNNSTVMQYTKPIPAPARASNMQDNTRFSVDDVMKYSQAADTPDPRKLIAVDRTKNSDFI